MLVRSDAGDSRWHHILRLEGAPVRPPGTSVQEPDGPDDILGGHGHADVRHVFCRLCVDVQVRMKPHAKKFTSVYLYIVYSTIGHKLESAL